MCRKGEMHRKCAIKDRGVEQGRAVVWSRAGQCARPSTVSLLLSVPALTIPQHCLNTFLTCSGDSQRGIQPGHSALSAQPTPTNQAQAKNHSSKANITQLQPGFISSASSYSLTCSEHRCSCQGLLWPGYSCSQA